MTLTFSDTETTGLSNSDKVISTGMIFCSKEKGEKKLIFIGCKEIFNTVDVPITKGSIVKHGITPVKLHQLSKGKSSRDVEPIIEKYFSLTDYALFFNKPFDHRMLHGTFRLNHLPKDKCIEVMGTITNKLGMSGKLEQQIKRCLDLKGKTLEDLEREYCIDCKQEGGSFHSAMFDAYCTARAYAIAKDWEWISNGY